MKLRKPVYKPTKKLIRAHFDAQRPLEQDATPVMRKKPRKWVEDEVPMFVTEKPDVHD